MRARLGMGIVALAVALGCAGPAAAQTGPPYGGVTVCAVNQCVGQPLTPEQSLAIQENLRKLGDDVCAVVPHTSTPVGSNIEVRTCQVEETVVAEGCCRSTTNRYPFAEVVVNGESTAVGISQERMEHPRFTYQQTSIVLGPLEPVTVYWDWPPEI